MTDLHLVDWSTLPVPQDDGGAAHLEGLRVPSLSLEATNGTMVDLSALPGRTVVYVYPRTGAPGEDVPADWDMIPGARGCTPQSCSFRDHFAELKGNGVDHLFGLSSQATACQQEAAARLHLPFPLLSDAQLHLASAMSLPTFEWRSRVLLKRMTLIVEDGLVQRVFYPAFSPDRSAHEVLAYLSNQSGGPS